MAAIKADDDVKKGRPLGFNETHCHVMIETESAGIYWHVGVINTNLPLDDHDVLMACKILIKKQEALQMRIVSKDPDQMHSTDFQFKPMEDQNKIDFESTTVKSRKDWPALLSRDHDSRKLDSTNGPLWGCILVRVEEGSDTSEFLHEYILMLKFSHAIVDAKSAFDLLYRQFLPIISAVINGGDKDGVVPFVPQTRSSEELFLTPETLKNPVPWYMKLGLDLFRWKNRVFKPAVMPVYRFTDDDILPEEELNKEPECVPMVFGEEICGPVLQEAKAHGVTVHCVLLTAGVIAFCRTADAAGIILPKSFKQAWTVDLRKFLDYTSPQPIGDLHGIGMTEHKRVSECSEDEFWKFCQDIAPVVKTEGEKTKCTKWLGLTKYFLDEGIKKSSLSAVMKEMGISSILSLSNIGNTSVGPQPKWTEGPFQIRLTDHFVTVCGLTKLDLGMLAQFVATFESRFMWIVIHDLSRHSRRFVDTYLENLKEVLKTFCSTP